MKNITILLIIITVFYSCNSDDDVNAVIITEGSQLIETKVNGSRYGLEIANLNLEFTYLNDNPNVLEKFSGYSSENIQNTRYNEFEYENEKVTSVYTVLTDSGGGVSNLATFEYDNTGRLISFQDSATYSLNYNGNQFDIVNNVDAIIGNGEIDDLNRIVYLNRLDTEYWYTYVDGNLTEYKIMTPDTTRRYEYDYDSSNNPLNYGSFTSLINTEYFSYYNFLNSNNMISERVYTNGALVSTFEYTYLYNDLNYPYLKEEVNSDFAVNYIYQE